MDEEKRLTSTKGGHYCCALNCTHRSGVQDCHFFSFPRDKVYAQKWVTAIKRQLVDINGRVVPGKLWSPSSHHRLCSCHFSKPPNPQARFPGWNHVVPDVFEFSKIASTPRTTKRSLAAGTSCITTESKSRRKLGFIAENTASTDKQIETGIVTVTDSVDETRPAPPEVTGIHYVQMAKVVHRDHDYHETYIDDRFNEHCRSIERIFPGFLEDLNDAKNVQEQYNIMLRKGQILKLEYLKEDKGLFQYYTGLPSFDVFKALLDYFHDKTENMQYMKTAGKVHNTVYFSSKPGPRRALSLEEEFFSTLVRLRLGLPSKHCSRLFGISESTFSVIFNTWVIVIANELEKVCCLPSVEKTMENTAPCFDKFPYTRIVLDCTELFSQTPGVLTNHKQMHSNYKHHSTVKFLVGMSPSGAITYISDMWGGRASDKKITKESTKLLNALECGDKVMVDRGFTIEEDLPPGVKLLIPPFKNRITGQFTPKQIQFSEKLSTARIHVERAMRAIKESRILEMEVKLAMINNFESIFKACAYLVNFKEPFLKVKK